MAVIELAGVVVLGFLFGRSLSRYRKVQWLRTVETAVRVYIGIEYERPVDQGAAGDFFHLSGGGSMRDLFMTHWMATKAKTLGGSR